MYIEIHNKICKNKIIINHFHKLLFLKNCLNNINLIWSLSLFNNIYLEYLYSKEVWNNPVYSMNEEFLKKLNEGTYFVDVINPILRAALNGIDSDNTYLTV